jgi:hypothetical protein
VTIFRMYYKGVFSKEPCQKNILCTKFGQVAHQLSANA